VEYFQYCGYGDFVIAFRSVTKNLHGLVEIDRTVCGDGSESVQGRVKMGVKSAACRKGSMN